jgi:hypothetical protein
MIDFFDRIHLFITNKRSLEKFLFFSYLGAVIERVLNYFAIIYFPISKNNLKYKLDSCSTEKDRVIVTLTSFPLRINKLWLVIESIFRQTVKPDKIVLWLSLDQFKSFDDLPFKLKQQVSRGLDIRLVSSDLKSHKKYYYSLKEFPEDKLIIIDDDIFYDSNLVKNLLEASMLFPNVVIARYCKKMIWEDGDLCLFNKMALVYEEEPPNYSLFFGSGGGTLISKNMFHEDVFNIDLFTLLTPTADDVWLNAMCRLKGSKIKCIGHLTNYLGVKSKNNTTLDSINNGKNQNDVQIKNVEKYYLSQINVNPFKC